LIESISGKLIQFQTYSIVWVRAHTKGDDEHSKNNDIVDRMCSAVLNGTPLPTSFPSAPPPSELAGPLQLMGPPVSDTALIKWCLANLDKLDEDALHSAVLSAYGKTVKKNGYEIVKQKLHRTTQYRLIASTHIVATVHNKSE
jgi:hypothetical protein